MEVKHWLKMSQLKNFTLQGAVDLEKIINAFQVIVANSLISTRTFSSTS